MPRSHKPTSSENKPNATWQFLNSTLFIWILSAVFITGGAKVYDFVSDARNTMEAIDRLNLEIAYRQCRMLVNLYSFTVPQTRGQQAPSYSPDNVKEIVYQLKQSNGTGGIYLYPDYWSFGITGLVAEQKRQINHLHALNDGFGSGLLWLGLTPNQQKKMADTIKDIEALQSVIHHLTGIEVFCEAYKVDFTDVYNVAGIIEDELLLKQWKAEGFYFFNGSKESPFP